MKYGTSIRTNFISSLYSLRASGTLNPYPQAVVIFVDPQWHNLAGRPICSGLSFSWRLWYQGWRYNTNLEGAVVYGGVLFAVKDSQDGIVARDWAASHWFRCPSLGLRNGTMGLRDEKLCWWSVLSILWDRSWMDRYRFQLTWVTLYTVKIE